MIHYLVIGHAAFEEQEWRHMMFNDEQPEEYLKAKFIQRLREDEYGWDEDKEIYVDFILQSNNLIHVNYG
jgi:hypothetical protein